MELLSTTTGTVNNDTLTYQEDGRVVTIAVASTDWYRWLESATSFTFRSPEGTFTAHKERASNRRGGWYWRAYRQQHRRLSRFYLGISSRLTPERLCAAASHLAHPVQEEKSSTNHRPTTKQAAPSSRLPILTTRLQIPRLPVQHVPRPHLIPALEQSAQRRLTLVSAPAGCGKTTLLAEWAHTAIFPTAWLSLEATDNDPARFLAYLTATLVRLNEQIAVSEQAIPSSWEEALTDLLNDLAQHLHQDAIVILDDYHLITSENIHAMLLFLLDHLPPQVHLIIGTRADPPWPLARLRARNQLGELHADELRFASAEVETFAHTMGLTLSHEATDLLQQRTEGWIAGVQLLALALRGQGDATAFLRAFRGTHRFLLDYVSEEVLAQQTPEMQRFLLRTCILDRLCGPLCDRVTGETGGQARLAELRHENLFVSALDETEIWYRYHALFTEALRTHLDRREPDLAPELYRRASLWYEHQHMLIEACDYAFRANDLPRAAVLLANLFPSLLEQGKIEYIQQHGGIEQLKRWLDQLPPELIAASPQLNIVSFWIQPSQDQSSEQTEKTIALLEQQLQGHSQEEASQVELQSEIARYRAQVASFHHDLPQAIALLRESLQMLSTRESTLSRLVSLRAYMSLYTIYREQGDLLAAEQTLLAFAAPSSPTTPLFSLSHIAVWLLTDLYEAQGHLRKKHSLFEEKFPLRSQEEIPELFLALLQISKATLCYELNRLPEAANLIQQALMVTQRLKIPFFSTLCLWVHARIESAQGRHGATEAFLRQQQQSAIDTHVHATPEQMSGYLAALSARLALISGDEEEALRWEYRCGIRFDDLPAIPLENRAVFTYLTLARLLIARGRSQRTSVALSQALTLLEGLHDLFAREHFSGWLMEAQMLTALTQLAQGKIKLALATLGPVLTQAEPEGYLRLFADEGLPMASLLAQISPWTSASPAYLQEIQAALLVATNTLLPAPSQAEIHQMALPESLSVREQEVLALLNEGYANQQIADHLVISLNTAKRHVKHILAKLAATNRTRAVTRARELHLL
jgi:LuxR family maltose regulon positive regulatory protein